MRYLYCISGLGADDRIFQKLSIPGVQLIHIPWPEYDKHDDVLSYAQKVSALIPDKKPMILGLSFGGMLAVEIANKRPVEKIFLVSSCKTKNELPRLNIFLRFLFSSGIIPSKIFTIPNKFIFERFGADTIEKKQLMASILKDSNGGFMKWAFKALLSWNNTVYPKNIVHIHGTADKILLPQFVHPNYWIEEGTHLIIYDRADEISKIIASNL